MSGAANRTAFDWLTSNIPFTEEEKAAQAANQEVNEAVELARMEEARLFFAVFGTGRGPELLDLLRGKTIELPLMDVSGSLVRGEVALSPAEWAYVREGQNSIVREIEAQLKLATRPPETPAAQPEGN